MTEVLASRDGRSTSTVVGRGADARGAVLWMEHRTTRVGPMAGPHWHPALTERFTVRSGRLAVALDGHWRTLGPGESVEAAAGQVHAFRCEAGELVMDHEVWPPAHHQEMFEVLAALDGLGRLTRAGLPANPLAIGLLWRLQDGYVAGVPVAVQRAVLGGLARLARVLGYERRLAVAAGWAPDRWAS